MDNNTTPQIFLSYSRKNGNIADEIDNDFKRVGISLMRDVRDAKYKSSIKEFMQRVGKSNFVLMIISDEFLRSDNCMYEVTELLNTHEFEKRILPVVLDNASGVFKAATRTEYYDYWKAEVKQAEKRSKAHPNLDLIEEAKRYRSIYEYIDSFFQKIKDLNVLTYEKLKNQNYRPLLDVVGFDDEQLLEEILSISKIEDREEQEIEIENFIDKYPNSWRGYLWQAYLENENKQYRKAKKHYEALIKRFPAVNKAHYNLAILLKDQFSDYAGAKAHYEKAIKINPNDVDGHYNLAILLKDQFSDYAAAKLHYERAIKINPDFADAHYNLANLLKQYFMKMQKQKNYT
jgi:tetratricopeptide (TPR) repeat protein